MTPVIVFKEQTNKLLQATFGSETPFVVVCKMPISEQGQPMGDRVYLTNGPKTVTVPNVQGLDIGQVLCIDENNVVHEWDKRGPYPEQTPVSNNQKQAQAYCLVPEYPRDF